MPSPLILRYTFYNIHVHVDVVMYCWLILMFMQLNIHNQHIYSVLVLQSKGEPDILQACQAATKGLRG